MDSEVRNFYDLRVWQDAHQLSLAIYAITKHFPKEEQFGLVSQMRRASSSITANIAEGFGRFHYNDKVRFYHQARGSAVELQDHLFLSRDLKYISEDDARAMLARADLVMKELNGLINSTKRQQMA